MKVEVAPTAAELMAQVEEFLNDRLHVIREHLKTEELPLLSLVGRTVAEDIISAIDLPRFRRAMMDGVAIDFRHLSAGCQRWPIVDDRKLIDSLSSPAAFPVATGAFVPDRLDTVLPRECLVSAPAPDNPDPEIKFIETPNVATVQRGQHVAQVGEDVRVGQILLFRGRVVRAQDLGLLSACGVTKANVLRRPRVAIGLTGNEIARPGNKLDGEQVHDANGPVLTTLLDRDGAQLIATEYLADDPQTIQAFLSRADVDVVILCGGTSVGPRDYVAEMLHSVGTVAFHGLPLRPGRPVGIGVTGDATVFLLPGNPIACQFTYDLLVGPLVRGASNQPKGWPYSRELVCLSEPVDSQRGRMDYLRVVRIERRGVLGGSNVQCSGIDCLRGNPNRVNDSRQPIMVRPLTSGRASNLTSVSEADGFVLVPIDTERLLPNVPVECFWYDH